MAGALLLSAPVIVEAHDAPPHHAQREDAVAIAHATVIFACADIETLVQTCFDGPIIAGQGDELLRREFFGWPAA